MWRLFRWKIIKLRILKTILICSKWSRKYAKQSIMQMSNAYVDRWSRFARSRWLSAFFLNESFASKNCRKTQLKKSNNYCRILKFVEILLDWCFVARINCENMSTHELIKIWMIRKLRKSFCAKINDRWFCLLIICWIRFTNLFY